MSCHLYSIVPHSPALAFTNTDHCSDSNNNGHLGQKPLKISVKWKLTLLREGHDSFRGVILELLCSWADLSVYMNNKKISTTLQALSRHLRWQHPSGFRATKMMKDKIEKVGGDTGEWHAHTEEWIRLPHNFLCFISIILEEIAFCFDVSFSISLQYIKENAIKSYVILTLYNKYVNKHLKRTA